MPSVCVGQRNSYGWKEIPLVQHAWLCYSNNQIGLWVWINFNSLWQSYSQPLQWSFTKKKEKKGKAENCNSRRLKKKKSNNKISCVPRTPTLEKSSGPWRQWWGTPDTSEQSTFVPRRQSRGPVHLADRGTHIHFLLRWTADPVRGHWQKNSAIHNRECPAPDEDSLSLKAGKTTEETQGFRAHLN